MSGKIAVVTGSDTGIGLETARSLAARHATVVLLGRNITKMEAAKTDIKRTVPDANLFVPQQPLDLSSFAMVREAVEGLKQFQAVHVLVNNAGVASTSHPVLTKDGFDLVFQVDYLAPWLLTHLLLPQLRAGKGRIVNVASKAAALACLMSEHWSCTDLERLPPPPTSGTVPLIGLPRSNYGIAKLLMIRWTEELARREAAAGVTAFSLHPGFVRTTMASSASKFFSWLACQSDGRQGIEKTSGGYYEWCAVADLPNPGAAGASESYQEELWKRTERWLANFSQPIDKLRWMMV